jgi:hypothetical protein
MSIETAALGSRIPATRPSSSRFFRASAMKPRVFVRSFAPLGALEELERLRLDPGNPSRQLVRVDLEALLLDRLADRAAEMGVTVAAERGLGEVVVARSRERRRSGSGREPAN